MKMSAISGISCYVKDLKKSVEFYENLGFRVGKEAEDRVSCYVNWFWVELVDQAKVEDAQRKTEIAVKDRGAGQYLYIKVDSIDDFYEGVKAKGYKPESEPQPMPGGGREFLLRDLDGYKLAFFERK